MEGIRWRHGKCNTTEWLSWNLIRRVRLWHMHHLPYLMYFALEMMWATYARDWFDRMENPEEI